MAAVSCKGSALRCPDLVFASFELGPLQVGVGDAELVEALRPRADAEDVLD